MLRVTDDDARARLRPEASAPDALITDLHLLGAITRRVTRRLQHGGGLLPPERARAWRLFDQVQTDFYHLQRRCAELRDARSGDTNGDLELTSEGPRDPSHRPGLQISRGAVRMVLKAGTPTVPRIERAEKAEPCRDQILEWIDRCRGNLVRVHEARRAGRRALVSGAHGVSVATASDTRRRCPSSTTTSTAEMQHDTSPHRRRSRASSSGSRPRHSCCATRACFFSRSTRPSRAFTAKSS